MRIDRGPRHLRVGRILVDWSQRTHPEAPRIDGAADFLTRVEAEAEVIRLRTAVASLTCDAALVRAERRDQEPEPSRRSGMLAIDAYTADGVRREVRQWARETLTSSPYISRERFDGLQIRHRRSQAIFVGLKGLRTMPHPARWRPKALYRRARWIMAGRPVPPPSGRDYSGPMTVATAQASGQNQ